VRIPRIEVSAMEIRARYIQVGVFTLATLVAGFVFVYWLNNASGLRDRVFYRVRFETPVAGLLGGSAVLFNGIRVGEVTALQLNPNNPREVTVTIAIEPSTPVRADTHVDIDFQGLAGAPVIAMKGGNPASPALATATDQPSLLVADPTAGQSLTQAARDALRRLSGLMAENAEPLHTTITNLNTFSAALARNSDKLDGIVAGLERMTGGARGKAPTVYYDLTAPRSFPPPAKVHGAQLVIPEPTALVVIDAQAILIRPAPVDSSAPPGQWSDSLPKLVQAKLIEAFDNANYLRAVGRPAEGFTADYKLLIDIRTFQVSVTPEPTAEVEFSAKILTSKGGMVSARVFRATAPATTADVAAAAAALDVAFGKTARELVLWTAGSL
jgi:phospholipid/cholesterol/gamma-HCH transport system substrate-binding protein